MPTSWADLTAAFKVKETRIKAGEDEIEVEEDGTEVEEI
jgi:hypothetical protein